MGSLHPAIVHIPIGLLFVYSLVEISLNVFPRFKDDMKLGKFIMLFVGVIGSIFALSSGEALEHTFSDQHALVELHSSFASLTVAMYGVLAAAFTLQYVYVYVCKQSFIRQIPLLQRIVAIFHDISHIITRRYITLILSILGLTSLVITGALGGALAHGPQADFVTQYMYNLFF